MPSALQPGGVVAWLIIGLLAGAISGWIVRGRGYGCLIDIVVGIIGAFVGGFIIRAFFPGTEFGFIGSLLVAIGGAAILLIVLRLLTGGGHRRHA